MNDLAEFLNLAAAPLPEGAEAVTAAIATVESSLDRLSELRATAESALVGATDRRRELLLDPRPKAAKALADLEERTRAAELDLERADVLEERLVEKLHGLERLKRNAGLNALVSEYGDAIDDFCAAMCIAAGKRSRLVEIRERAVATGFEGLLGQFPMPYNNMAADLGAIAQFRQGAHSELRQMSLPKPSAAVYPIRFLKTWEAYHSGVTAAFSAEQAHAIVGAGIAVWADPRRRPPRTAVPVGEPR